MGVRNYVIEGVSCAGKTTVCDALQQRGYHAVHGDRDLAYWGDPQTGEPSNSKAYEHWIWDLDKVGNLIADQGYELTFLCGGTRNLDRFIDRLDGVLVLEIDTTTLNQRLSLRPDSEWSGSPSAGASNARIQHAKKEYVPRGAIIIDATASIEEVVASILEHCNPPA